jgi:hypothetical protein
MEMQNNKKHMAGGMAQVIERLPCEREALIQI